MRILIAHSSYRVFGGEDRYVSQQIELLSGHHVVRPLTMKNTDLRTDLTAARRMIYSRSLIHKVEAEITNFRPDVVHVHNVYPSFGPSVHIASQRTGVPLVATIHNFRLRCPNGLTFTEGEECRRCTRGNHMHALIHKCFPDRKQAAAYATTLWSHRFVLDLEGKVDRFLVPSIFLGDALSGMGVDPGKMTVLPNFVEENPDATSLPGTSGLFVGRLSREKGLLRLMQALKILGDPPFKIAGDGPLIDDVRRLREELGLARTEILGHVSGTRVRSLLREARFLVIPSLCNENAPLAALEGMAAGRPLAVAARGGLPELVESGSGLQFDSDDLSDISRCLKMLWADDDLCRRLGAIGLREFRTRFSPAIHRSGLEETYRWVLDARR